MFVGRYSSLTVSIEGKSYTSDLTILVDTSKIEKNFDIEVLYATMITWYTHICICTYIYQHYITTSLQELVSRIT